MAIYSEQQMISHLIELKNDLNRVPSMTDEDNSDGPCAATYQNRFGSWGNAIREAGMKPQEEYTRPELVENLIALKKKLGHVPRRIDITKSGGPGVDTYMRWFGSYDKAIEATGLVPPKPYVQITDEEIVEKVKEAHSILGHVPSLREMDTLPGFPCQSVFVERMGWKNALKKAGLPDKRQPNYIPSEKLLQDVKDYAKVLGRPPKFREMEKEKKYSNPKTIADRFGIVEQSLGKGRDAEVQQETFGRGTVRGDGKVARRAWPRAEL